MPVRACALAFAAAASLGLAGCERVADTGATANPNAPGSPGTGNPTRVVTPMAPDSPARPPPGDGVQGGMGAGPVTTPAGTGTSATSAPGGNVPDGSARGETGQR